MANSLLDDVFTVQKLDPDGKKFDKGSFHRVHRGFASLLPLLSS